MVNNTFDGPKDSASCGNSSCSCGANCACKPGECKC
ncbi:hypothetical protein RSAG8_02324, partial [Rhizoctonia solani AG-8 WAC10335]